MKVLAINASPRTTGNTASLVDKALEGAGSKGAGIKRIDLAGMQIRPLTEDDYTVSFDAVRSDVSDDLAYLIEEMSSSDVLMIASPIFFGSLTGQLKTMIDRFQFAWREKNTQLREIFPKRKRGAFISVQAQDRSDFFGNASSIVRHFFATVNVSYDAELFFGELEAEGDAVCKDEYMEKAFRLGQSLAG